MISSRNIERACRENVLFMAISGDCAPQFTTLAKFVRELRSEITELFTQVLLTCDAQGLIGRQMFAIDGVKLPSNAAKNAAAPTPSWHAKPNAWKPQWPRSHRAPKPR